MKRLLEWYNKNKRDIPFRNIDNPYYTWVSEIMLQQTQVKTVIPYFKRFINTLPTIEDLAYCDEETLLSLWDGLGYYSRVRNLQVAANQIIDEYNGTLPKAYDDLIKLKGIGDYTAGAILSIAYNQAVPAIDGNVLRIYARLHELDYTVKDVKLKKIIKELVLKDISQEHPGDFNQALMDLGAQVCTGNKQPLCKLCPLNDVCISYKHKTVSKYPKKAPKKLRKVEYVNPTLFIYDDYVMIERRPETGLLKSMNQFPLLSSEELASFEYTVLKPTKHLFSHIEWRIETHIVILDEMIENKQFVPINNIGNYSIPRAFKQALNYLANKD